MDDLRELTRYPYLQPFEPGLQSLRNAGKGRCYLLHQLRRYAAVADRVGMGKKVSKDRLVLAQAFRGRVECRLKEALGAGHKNGAEDEI